MGVAETGYPLISVYEDFTPDKSLKRYGSSSDWSFGSLGIPTFSTELWDVFNAAGIAREDFYPLRNFPEADWLKLLRWQDEALGGFTRGEPWLPLSPANLARAVAQSYYESRGGLTEARLRMARGPEGAGPIPHRYTGGPGHRTPNRVTNARVAHTPRPVPGSARGTRDAVWRAISVATPGAWPTPRPTAASAPP